MPYQPGQTVDAIIAGILTGETPIKTLPDPVLVDLVHVLSARLADDTVDSHLRLLAAAIVAHTRAGDTAAALGWLAAFDLPVADRLIAEISTTVKGRARAA